MPQLLGALAILALVFLRRRDRQMTRVEDQSSLIWPGQPNALQNRTSQGRTPPGYPPPGGITIDPRSGGILT